VRAFGNDPSIDTIVVPLAPRGVPDDDRPAMICGVGPDVAATLCVYWMSPWLEGPGAELIAGDPATPIFHSIDRLFTAVQQRTWWDSLRQRLAADGSGRPDGSVPPARVPGLSDLLDEFTADAGDNDEVALNELESMRVCERAGLRFAPARAARSAAEARAAARAVGYPVAVKVLSRDITHKTAAGGVRLAIASPADVGDAVTDIEAATERSSPDARRDGCSSRTRSPAAARFSSAQARPAARRPRPRRTQERPAYRATSYPRQPFLITTISGRSSVTMHRNRL
jgi:acetate---CoA ligase (ADP-forming)